MPTDLSAIAPDHRQRFVDLYGPDADADAVAIFAATYGAGAVRPAPKLAELGAAAAAAKRAAAAIGTTQEECVRRKAAAASALATARSERAHLIRDAYAAGASAWQVARAADISIGRVNQLVAGVRRA